MPDISNSTEEDNLNKTDNNPKPKQYPEGENTAPFFTDNLSPVILHVNQTIDMIELPKTKDLENDEINMKINRLPSFMKFDDENGKNIIRINKKKMSAGIYNFQILLKDERDKQNSYMIIVKVMKLSSTTF